MKSIPIAIVIAAAVVETCLQVAGNGAWQSWEPVAAFVGIAFASVVAMEMGNAGTGRIAA